jgi:signal transduction histidine kinase
MLPVIIASESTARASDVVSIVHDLRNPLATIHGGAEILAGSILSQTQVQRIGVNMYRASVRMRELLEEFLDQSRRAAKQMELSDLRELVTSAVDEIAARAELQSVDIVRVVPERLSILLDRHRIHRVLVNLLVNALEAMQHGGRIFISAVSSGRSVLIRVRDSGPGIAPEITDRLFQPFATAGKTDGIGLGLASSRQTVLDHDGEMWVEPSFQGACFAVRLPLDRTTAHGLPGPNTRPSHPAAAQKQVARLKCRPGGSEPGAGCELG